MSGYNNLPGVNVNIKDGQLLITDDNTTNSMLIIGQVKAESSVQVPEEPILVRTEEELFNSFGRYFHRGELNPVAAEWKIAKDANVQNTYVLGIVGNTEKDRFIYLQDMLYNSLSDYSFSHIVVTGMYADEDIVGLTADDFSAKELGNIPGLRTYQVLEGTANAKEIIADATTPEFTVRVDNREVTATITETINDPRDLVRELTSKLKTAISQAGIDLDIDISIINQKAQVRTSQKVSLEGAEVLAALSIDTLSQEPEERVLGNVAQLLGDFAERQTIDSGASLVYIPTKPVVTTNRSEISKSVDALVKRNNEVSKHVQIVAGPEVGVSIPGSLRTQWVSGVTNYAVLINSLAVQNAPTNQPLPGIRGLRYNLSLKQLNELVGNKYVTFRSKNNRIIVVDGVTTAPDIYTGEDVVHSDFRRVTTLRSTNYMVNGIREVVDPFIGRPNEFPTYNAMNTAIRGFINSSIDKGVIQDAVYSIDMGNNLDVANINLTILPQFELRKIDVQIGLSTPQGFKAISE